MTIWHCKSTDGKMMLPYGSSLLTCKSESTHAQAHSDDDLEDSCIDHEKPNNNPLISSSFYHLNDSELQWLPAYSEDECRFSNDYGKVSRTEKVRIWVCTQRNGGLKHPWNTKNSQDRLFTMYKLSTTSLWSRSCSALKESSYRRL